jgi:hypothetical protein
MSLVTPHAEMASSTGGCLHGVGSAMVAEEPTEVSVR